MGKLSEQSSRFLILTQSIDPYLDLCITFKIKLP